MWIDAVGSPQRRGKRIGVSKIRRRLRLVGLGIWDYCHHLRHSVFRRIMDVDSNNERQAAVEVIVHSRRILNFCGDGFLNSLDSSFRVFQTVKRA